MSITYRIDQNQGVTLVLWEDIVSASAFIAHVRKLCEDPAWPPAKRLHLSDLRFARLDDSMDEKALQEAADLYGKHGDKIANMKVAIVANDSFLKAVDFERLISRFGATVIVFNYPDTACLWLNLDAHRVEHELDAMRKPD